MARVRKYRGKKSKSYDWMQTHVNLKWTTAGTDASPYADSVYIDVAQCLSALNRKLVRQGQLFRIRNMRAYTNDTDPNVTIAVGAIPTTWMTRNAWVKAKALWDEMNDAATTDIGSRSVYPKWHDFKVFMDTNHRTEHAGASSTDADLMPVSFTDGAITGGEWAYSKFADSGSTSDNYDVHMLGIHSGSAGAWNSVGLIHAYAQSRTYPKTDLTATDQEVAASIEDSPWALLFGDDDQTSDVIDNLQADNDDPPYHQTLYNGGSLGGSGYKVAITPLQNLNNKAGGTSLTNIAPSFVAPCGLIRIEIDGEASTASMQGVHISFDVDILGPMDM